MTRSHRLRCYVLSAAVAAACGAPAAHALRMELGAGVGAEYTSNVLRSEDNERDEVIGVTWGGLALHENAANLTAEVAGVVESRQYINDEAEDDVLFSLASIVDWMVLPQRLNWHFEDYYQQSRVNPLETYSPDNRQDTNVLWTGPDLYFRFAQLYTLELGARYGNFYYEDSNGDNQRFAGIARAVRRLSPDSEIYLQGEQTRTEFDNEGEFERTGDVLLRNFDRSDAFVGFRWESVLTELQIEGGASRVSRDGDAEDIEEPLGRLFLRRRLPGEGAVGMRLATQLTEAGGALLASHGGRLDVDPTAIDITHDISRRDSVELFYYGRWWGGVLDLRLLWADEDYQEADLDQRDIGGAIHYGLRLSPVWTVGAFGGYREVEYLNLARLDKRALVGIGASHRLSRRISIDLELRDEWQNSNVDARDFNEVIALIELRYGERPTWSER